jgi:N-methylhydantoinase B/oxoprolinase/acetone carboxylase alpha subunit
MARITIHEIEANDDSLINQAISISEEKALEKVVLIALKEYVDRRVSHEELDLQKRVANLENEVKEKVKEKVEKFSLINSQKIKAEIIQYADKLTDRKFNAWKVKFESKYVISQQDGKFFNDMLQSEPLPKLTDDEVNDPEFFKKLEHLLTDCSEL